MSPAMPAVPAGSGAHAVPLIVISARSIDASSAFYATVFGWKAFPMGADLISMLTPGGPGVALRGDVPDGFPGIVPFITVPAVEPALARLVAGGATVDREPWSIPTLGTMARFRDPSGTIYGLTTGIAPGATARVPMPFGDNPKPPVHTVCSLEMYASDGAAAGAFFGEHFGWGSAPTMPHFVGFDAGAGIGGVFQSHTPVSPAVAYVYVDDVTATLTAIDNAGGKRMGDAMAMPGMATFGYFADPSGTMMGLIGP